MDRDNSNHSVLEDSKIGSDEEKNNSGRVWRLNGEQAGTSDEEGSFGEFGENFENDEQEDDDDDNDEDEDVDEVEDEVLPVRWLDRCGNQVSDIFNEAEIVEMMPYDYTQIIFRDTGTKIRRCRNLRAISLVIVRPTEEQLILLFKADGQYHQPLESFQMVGNDLRAREIAVIRPFLSARKSVGSLTLMNNRIDNEGAQVIAEILNAVTINELNVDSNRISAEGISRILSSENASSLKLLRLKDNIVGRDEICEVCRFLRQENISLESLEIGITRSTGPERVELYEILLGSLQKNTTLQRLWVSDGGNREEVDRDKIIAVVESLICNTTSFDAFCQSNDVLYEISFDGLTPNFEIDLPPMMDIARNINASSLPSINAKLRHKLQKIYFRGVIDMQTIISMDLVFMPRVLELATRDDFDGSNDLFSDSEDDSITVKSGNLNGVYQFVRNWNLSELLNFMNCKSRLDSGSKRSSIAVDGKNTSEKRSKQD